MTFRVMATTALLAAPALLCAQAPGTQCANGIVERIEILNEPVFPSDSTNPGIVRWTFAAANGVRFKTARSFIRRELLFEEGDCYDAFLVAESRRILAAYRFIDQVDVATSGDSAGPKVVRVRTRDRWSTQIDLAATYDAGLNLEKFNATEINFLGRGMLAEVNHHERRERRDQYARLASPRFFGRTDADVRIGRTSAGRSVYQRLNHGFVGEASRWSWTESTERTDYFQTYGTGGSESFSHLLVPMTRDGAEIAGAIRLGSPGRSWILGVAIDHTVYRQNGAYEVVENDDFGGSVPGAVVVPASVARQTVNRGATRLALHAGVRRLRYVDYTGLDALSEVRIVPSGIEASVGVGKSLGIFVPAGVPDAGDAFVRATAIYTKAADWGVFRLNALGEAGRAGGAWRDMLGTTDAAMWVRTSMLPAQTLFLRASAGGGWRTTIPLQLALGGRDGVRSLLDDQHPGGRRVTFTVEDRIRFGLLDMTALEFGATLFADAGRVWPGDVPYGTDFGWRGSAGFGLRIVTPRGAAETLKPEIAFPVGFRGKPVFRITAELNSVRALLRTPRVLESRRFWRGAESF